MFVVGFCQFVGVGPTMWEQDVAVEAFSSCCWLDPTKYWTSDATFDVLFGSALHILKETLCIFKIECKSRQGVVGV